MTRAALTSIAVFVDARASSDARLDLGKRLAARDDATLAVTFVHLAPVLHDAKGAPDAFARGAGLGGMIDRFADGDRDARRAVVERLAALAHDHPGHVTFREVSLQARLRDVVPLCRYADVAILGDPAPHDPADRPYGWSTAELVHESGVPSLIVPERARDVALDGPAVIAWNATRESRRAIVGGLPLLARAREAIVLVVDAKLGPTGHREDIGADMAAFLTRHGVRSRADRIATDGSTIAEAILRYVEEIDAGLLVAGAYGHSRMAEFLLGSTTERLLAEATIPLFLSH